jgi:protein disulfide-isomerase
MRFFIATALLTAVASIHAATSPYDESADAKSDIHAALVDAAAAKMSVLVVFGTNWCGDCRALDNALKSGSSAPLIQKSFAVVKVDVGHFDRNVELAASYGVPLKSGIPAVAILSADGKALYATSAGELADARKMSDAEILQFFTNVVKTDTKDK